MPIDGSVYLITFIGQAAAQEPKDGLIVFNN
jgi:hypothetical protein